MPNCGEVWALSGVDENISIVSNGFLKGNELNELIEIYMGDLVGDAVYEKFGTEFPLLIKFIDANDYLSIQVHPDDELAAKRKIGFGKSEMWYIIQADENAELISGFSCKTDKASYATFEQNGIMTTASFDDKGHVVQMMRYSKANILPDIVTDALNVEFGKKEIHGVTEVTNSKGTVYKVFLKDSKK